MDLILVALVLVGSDSMSRILTKFSHNRNRVKDVDLDHLQILVLLLIFLLRAEFSVTGIPT